MIYFRAIALILLCGLVLTTSGCNDGGGSVGTNSSPTAKITVTTATPLMAGATISVFGAGSTDPQAQPLTHAWTLLTTPAGSTAAISPKGGDPSTAQFVADRDGVYTVRLEVKDSTSLSGTTDLDVTMDKARWGAATWGTQTFSAP